MPFRAVQALHLLPQVPAELKGLCRGYGAAAAAGRHESTRPWGPLGKGETVNYFYSLEMTYLIHSVSYLPSGLSSWTYESYKHIYCFIFGDRKRGEGYAMRSGGKGKDGLINMSRPHWASLGHGRAYPVLVDSSPCEGLQARSAFSLVWEEACHPLATTLDKAHFKREKITSSAIWPFFHLRKVCVGVWVCVCVCEREREGERGRGREREEETICWQWNYFCTLIQITPNWTSNLLATMWCLPHW